MTTMSEMSLWMALASLTFVGCRGGATAPRRTPPGHSVPSTTPLDGGGGGRGHQTVRACLRECRETYGSCKRQTPDCEAYDRLHRAMEAIVSSDGGAAETQTYRALLPQLLNRSFVCVTICGAPNGLCADRCLNAWDAGPPQR